MSEPETPPPGSAGIFGRILWFAVLAVVTIVPLVVDPRGRDLFVLPKSVVFQIGMLVVAAIAVTGALLHDSVATMLGAPRRAVLLASAALAWVAVVSMTAIVPAVSREAPFTMFCYAVLFVVSAAVARDGGLLSGLTALLLPALINALLVLCQALGIWQPFTLIATGPERLGHIGLIGNPNTVGTYLLLPTIVALAGTIAVRRYRIVFASLTLILLVAIFQAQTVTVLASLAVALLAFAMNAGKRVRVLAISVAVLGLVAVVAYGPTRQRLQSLKNLLRSREMVAFSSGRIPATAAALRMFTEHPIQGVGPGGFAARYMPYRLAVEESFPEWVVMTRENFGEAHNDHAQILAETGLPGYALFLLALLGVGSISFRRSGDDERARLTKVVAFPAAIGFAVLAIAQFPLHLTAVAASAVFLAGLCWGWRGDARG
jgi:putative inorganic carbon (hco3(-)) transporter